MQEEEAEEAGIVWGNVDGSGSDTRLQLESNCSAQGAEEGDWEWDGQALFAMLPSELYAQNCCCAWLNRPIKLLFFSAFATRGSGKCV